MGKDWYKELGKGRNTEMDDKPWIGSHFRRTNGGCWSGGTNIDDELGESAGEWEQGERLGLGQEAQMGRLGRAEQEDWKEKPEE